jgi:hypothetical protein
MLQSQWSSMLNPLLHNPSLNSRILSQVVLTTGANTINHGLGRELQGWRIVRLRSLATIYDAQDSNAHPDLTLVLVSSATTVCDLEVF